MKPTWMGPIVCLLWQCLPCASGIECYADELNDVQVEDTAGSAGQQGPRVCETVDRPAEFRLDGLDVGRFAEKETLGSAACLKKANIRRCGEDALDWRSAVERLAAEDGEKQSEAIACLLKVLNQTRDEELSGKARCYPDFFASSSGLICPARDTRSSVLGELERKSKVPAIVPILCWYLTREHVLAFQHQAAETLAGVQGPEADALVLELVTKPNENAYVTAVLLDAVRNRGLALPPKVLMPLCQHYRKTIREAARQLSDQLGYPEPPAFDRVKVVRSCAIQEWMERLGKKLVVSVEAETPYVEIEFAGQRGGDVWSFKYRGWLLETTAEDYVLLEPEGWLSRNKCTIKPDDVNRGLCLTSVVRNADITEDVRRASQLRRRAMEDRKTKAHHDFPFDRERIRWVQGGTPYEIILAFWLYLAGRYESAADVLFPALDTFYTDDAAIDLTVNTVASRLGYQMLSEFVGSRDYPRTMWYARRIVQDYPESQFSDYAAELLNQLPQRDDDFRTFVLPTPAQWSRMRSGMSREEQITFLCERMRLLNGFQTMAPGCAELALPQFREPRYMKRDATWGGAPEGGTEVINPYTELTGYRWRNDEADETNEGGLALPLTVADLPAILPFLKDDWYIPSVDFGELDSPYRRLLRTRHVLCMIINDITKYTFCDEMELDAMSPAEIEQKVQSLEDWARANIEKSGADLLVQILQEGLNQKKRWFDVRVEARELALMGDKRGAPLILRYLLHPSADRFDAGEILTYCRYCDPQVARHTALQFLEYDGLAKSLRMEAAMILLKAGDVTLKRQELAALLHEARHGGLFWGSPADVVAVFLEEPQASQDAAEKPREDWSHCGDEYRLPALRAFAQAGFREAYEIYIELLKVDPVRLEEHELPNQKEWEYGEIADEIIYRLAPDDPAIKAMVKEHGNDSVALYAALAQWLKVKLKECNDGAP